MACHRGLAIITGGAGGLGLALAHRFLKSGGRRVRLLDKVSASVGQAAGLCRLKIPTFVVPRDICHLSRL